MIGTEIFNYKILSVIGEGGMGTVYLGKHEKLDRKVAIKVLLPEFARNPEIRERFINEAKTLSKLNHQNIVTLYDFTEFNKNLFLIMEFIDGTGLDLVINRLGGSLSVQRCIKIFQQILSGFEYAHSQGIVHRDIKPSNIILKTDDTPKILDFGIAKIILGDSKLTRTGTRMGSVLYMSPEQVLGKEIDPRSDIYSLGVTLFEMLTGKVPYDTTTNSDYEIQNKIVNEQLPPTRNIIPHITPEIDNIIAKATAKNPLNRFYNCAEFSNALLSLSSPHPVTDTSSADKKTIIQSQNNWQSHKSSDPKQKNNKIILIGVLSGVIIIAVLLIIFITSDGTEEKKKTTVIDSLIKKNKTINENEVRTFITQWQSYQNSINISGYLSQYSSDFQGIKRTKSGKTFYLNYSEWSADRSKMYSTAENLYIGVTDIVVRNYDNNNGTVEATFKQTYTSKKYTDEGQKILKIKKDYNDVLKIYYEELIYSTESIGD